MSQNTELTHYRKAFPSPYLSSADLVAPIVLTIDYVSLELDKTKKSKDKFNTVYFVEKEIRQGEPLKPMILNAGNCKTMTKLTGSPFIQHWKNLKVTIYVEGNVKFGKDTVEGLRISPVSPEKLALTPENSTLWGNAKKSYKKNGNLDNILKKVIMSPEHQQQLIEECNHEMA